MIKHRCGFMYRRSVFIVYLIGILVALPISHNSYSVFDDIISNDLNVARNVRNASALTLRKHWYY